MSNIEGLKKEYAKKFGIRLGINDFLSIEAQTEDAKKFIVAWEYLQPYLQQKEQESK